MLAIKRKENPSTVVISLSKDATTDEITDILLENGLIANRDFSNFIPESPKQMTIMGTVTLS